MISVIIPIYKTESYIERCVRSLMEQTLKEIEYIFINDCTPDHAMEIVEKVIDEYPERKRSVKIINHGENKGLACTRAEGLSLAKGDYIIYCDSDDWVDKDFYKEMYEVAKAEDADMVTGNYMLEKADVKYNCALPLWKSWEEFYQHPKWEFLAIWCHLIRREFLTSSCLDFYKDVDYSEDYGLLFRCYYYSKKNAVYRGSSYYHYNKLNDGSMTAHRHSLHNLLHKERCLAHLSEFAKDKGKNPLENTILSEEKRAVKEGYILCLPPDFKRWQKAFPEISRIVVNDKRASIPYRIAWWLGQNIHPSIFKLYVRRGRMIVCRH